MPLGSEIAASGAVKPVGPHAIPSQLPDGHHAHAQWAGVCHRVQRQRAVDAACFLLGLVA